MKLSILKFDKLNTYHICFLNMKGIKDVIHGHVKIGEKLMNLIDTPIFQRLGRIKQLTSAEYVFPGARHSRKEHSIGAMYLALKYSKSIGLDKETTYMIAAAALYHDIAHGPYSHSWDTVVYSQIYPSCHKGHDCHRHKIIDYVDNLEHPESIKDIWNGNNLLLSAILQGPLGVDRMDFVARDTMYTAARHFGFIESERIINHASVHSDNGETVLAYHEKIIPDAIQGLQSRLYMYNTVYLNKTVIAASILIEAALTKASTYLNLVDRTTNIDSFVYLNDTVMSEIILSQDQSIKMKEARKYAKRLYNRDLPKMINEDIVYVSPEIKNNHTPGLQIDEEKGEITWISRILSNDFEREFTKYNIHVKTNTKTISFKEYWKVRYPHYTVETYYIKRVYKL